MEPGDLGRLVLSVRLPGPYTTRNPRRQTRDRRHLLRHRLEWAVRGARRVSTVSDTEPLIVRIFMVRPTGWTGDADNLAKPILDGLGDILGRHANGRARDERVRGLSVWIDPGRSPEGELRVEVWTCRIAGAPTTRGYEVLLDDVSIA